MLKQRAYSNITVFFQYEVNSSSATLYSYLIIVEFVFKNNMLFFLKFIFYITISKQFKNIIKFKNMIVPQYQKIFKFFLPSYAFMSKTFE